MSEDKRLCEVCGKEVKEGYCIGDGAAYYCSEECLHAEMTQDEYLELYEQDLAYWTEWE